MAYQQKLWQNRLSEYPTRRLLTKLNEGDDTILVEVTREEGTIMQQGDAFSAANMNDLEQRIAAGIGGGDENMATIEQGPNSANPYAVNDLLIYNGQLYRVTKAIIVGNSLVSGVNITPTTLSKEVKTTQTNLATTQTNLSNLTTRVSTAESNITSANTRINTANTNITNVANRATALEGELTANSKRIYMDYKNGKYGINTAAGRGADTFIPFNNCELKSVYTGSFHVAHWSPATVYTTTKKYKYLFVFFNNNPQAYISVHFTISAGTEYYQYNYYYYAHSFAIFQNVPSGAKITATSSGGAEQEVTMEGNIWGIED